MPKLSDERRKQWEDHRRHDDEFQARIEAKYGRKQKRHAECRLCGDMVTAREPDDVWDALEAHERSHPEYDEWTAIGKEFPITSLRDIFHDHDCVFVKCACQCGCQSEFCAADVPAEERNMPMICEMCTLYQGRGHVEHRLQGE